MKFFSVLTAGSVVLGMMLSHAARADDPSGPPNIGSAENGAYIIYSSPLKGGKSANYLTQDSDHKLSFDKTPGPKLIVFDLGKSYALSDFTLKYKNPVGVKIYVLTDKPDNGDWSSVLSGKPDFSSGGPDLDANLNGHVGRYIVFFASSDPGPFYGLFITGIFVPHPNGNGFGRFFYAHNDDGNQNQFGGEGPIGEPPFPRHDYNPPVPNPSP